MAIRRRPHEERELDLAALVDIFSNMLFFLLATVSFLQLKTLNAAVPVLSSGEVSTGKSIDVSVEIRADGYMLKAQGQSPDPNISFTPVSMPIPRRDGKLDAKELQKQLWDIKKVAPETKNIMIFPEPGTVFDDIVLTMDTSRDMPSITNAKNRVQLFPRPVLSELVVEDAPKAGAP
jgi:biopolymer transport protein ExbD